MPLETATYISDLNSANPTVLDEAKEGDDHLRLLKSTIKTTFPNVTGAVLPTHTELNFVDGVTSPIQTQIDNAVATIYSPLVYRAKTVLGAPAAQIVFDSSVLTKKYTEILVVLSNVNVSTGTQQVSVSLSGDNGTSSTLVKATIEAATTTSNASGATRFIPAEDAVSSVFINMGQALIPAIAGRVARPNGAYTNHIKIAPTSGNLAAGTIAYLFTAG